VLSSVIRPNLACLLRRSTNDSSTELKPYVQVSSKCALHHILYSWIFQHVDMLSLLWPMSSSPPPPASVCRIVPGACLYYDVLVLESTDSLRKEFSDMESSSLYKLQEQGKIEWRMLLHSYTKYSGSYGLRPRYTCTGQSGSHPAPVTETQYYNLR